MTPRPSNLPARPLPIYVRPFPRETVGSYARRLADANRVPFAEFLDHLGDDRTPRRPTLVSSHELHLNQPAAERLATFSAVPTAALRHALPGLTIWRPGHRPLRHWNAFGRTRRPIKACPRCAARAGGGEILIYQFLHQTICPRHGRWLAGRDDNRTVDLTLLPEVIAAARRHIRLTRHREPSALKNGYRQANEIAQDWFDRSSFLTPIWHERYDRLGATHAYGCRVITYPETVGLTSLLSSPHWLQVLQRGNYHLAIPAFLREAGRRIGHPYPDHPRNDPLRYWTVNQWAGTPRPQAGHIDW